MKNRFLMIQSLVWIFAFLLCGEEIAACERAASSKNQTIDEYREKAKQGDLDSIYILVEELTDGAPQYNEEAEFWLRSAAKRDPRAVLHLAEMLLLKKDDQAFEEAILLLRSQVKNEGAAAYKRIGDAYFQRKLFEESVGWFQAAALMGNYDAAVSLSNVYFDSPLADAKSLSVYWACRAISSRDDQSYMTDQMRKRLMALTGIGTYVCPTVLQQTGSFEKK